MKGIIKIRAEISEKETNVADKIQYSEYLILKDKSQKQCISQSDQEK